jgi:hypothetical protein
VATSEADNGTLGAVPDIFELASLDQAWPHRFGGCLPFQGLDAGQFIGADDMHTEVVQQRRVGVEGTNRLNVLGKGQRVRFGGVQPVAAAMGFEFGLPLKNARPG